MERKAINPWTWQDQFSFTQAVKVTDGQHILHCAGQISVDQQGAVVHVGDMPAQIEQAFDNLEVVLKEAGFILSDVVRLNYYTTDMKLLLNNIKVVKQRLDKYGCQLSSTVLDVTDLAFPGLLIEIEATAVK